LRIGEKSKSVIPKRLGGKLRASNGRKTLDAGARAPNKKTETIR